MAQSLASLFTQSHFSLHVISRHRHACNLRTEQGELVALVAAELGNGPFHVVAPDSLLSHCTSFDNAGGIAYRNGYLCWPGGSLDLQTAALWDAQVNWPPSAPEPRRVDIVRDVVRRAPWRSLFADAIPSAQFSVSMQRRGHEGARALSVGLHTGDMTQVERGVHLLAGLGPGLTPAGDDFLLGVLAGLWMLLANHSIHGSAQSLCVRIGAIAAARTTRLSANWLRHAANGEFGQPWHDLARALRSADAPAVESAAQRILAVGATSGADALWGFVTAAEPMADGNR